MAINEVKNEQDEEVKTSNEINENVVSAETVKAETNNSDVKNTKNEKIDKKADNKKSKKVKDGKPSAISKTMSELKKVSWPSFGSVVKQTLVVIVVSLAFLIVIFGIDRLCSWLMGLIC